MTNMLFLKKPDDSNEALHSFYFLFEIKDEKTEREAVREKMRVRD